MSLAGQKAFYETKNNRRALFASTELFGQSVLIGSIHNDSIDMTNNEAQARQIVEFIGDRPCFLAGDFNANPNTPPMAVLQASGKFSGRFFCASEMPMGEKPTEKVKDDPNIPKTFPTHAPEQHLDYIFGPKSWEHYEFAVVKWPSSDHLPVYAVFGWKE